MYRLFVLFPLASVLVVGCAKEKTASPTVPAVAPQPVADRAPPPIDPTTEALRRENTQLRSEVASLKVQLEQATKTLVAWKEWSERQTKASQAAPSAPPPPPSAPKTVNVSELCMTDLMIGQIGPLQVQSGNKQHPRVTVEEVLSKDEFIASWGRKKYLIKGISTQGLVDRTQLDLSGVFEASTAKLSGWGTVFVLNFIRN